MLGESAKNNKRKHKRGLPAAAAVGLTITGIALIGVYTGVAVYYNNHYYPKTTVGGIVCGNQTAAQVEALNIQNADSYLITVADRKGSSYQIAGLDFNYQYVPSGEEAAILDRQHPLAWPVEIFRQHDIELNRSFSYDTTALTELIDRLTIFDEAYIQAPEDAHLKFTDDGYTVVEEVMGNLPIREQIHAEITQAIDAQEMSYVLSDACYEPPKVYATDSIIADTAAQLDQYMTATIHYEIDGVDENLTAGKILTLLDISEDGLVTVNNDKIAQFVQKMASTYNTYGDVREFVTSKEDVIRIGGGDYGWVINKAEEAAQILRDLSGGVPVSREPVYEQRAVKSGLDDIGDTYIEIDYTNQHLWYYKEGKLVTETDIVSGNISRGNGSPDGIYKIVYCQRDATLVGEDYASSVKYFMPFAYNVGIHDASWRNKFGDEIYKTSGSHGCINVPEKVAKKIIDTVELGTPVIAYYREPVILSAENARISNAYSYVEPEKPDTEQ